MRPYLWTRLGDRSRTFPNSFSDNTHVFLDQFFFLYSVGQEWWKHPPRPVLQPLPYSTAASIRITILRLFADYRHDNGAVFPTLLFLARSCANGYLCYTIGSFPNAPHDLLCSLSGNSLINLYWSYLTPGTIEHPDEPSDTTRASFMYLHAVLGFFQNALCTIVDRSSPANARETAPPRPERMHREISFYACW